MAKKPNKHATPQLKISWEKIIADDKLMDAISLFCSMMVKRDWRPCVRAQALLSLNALTTMLIALDGEYQHTLKLLDKDAGWSATGKLVKPVKRKKTVRSR